MPSRSADYVRIYHNSLRTVADDSEFSDSDMEDLSSNGDYHKQIPKDYWFGKKYFECVLAEDLFSGSPIDEAASVIDARLAVLTRSFPYKRALESLNAEGIHAPALGLPSGEQDIYESLLCLIGNICRTGAVKQKRVLLSTLRTCVNSPESTDNLKPDFLMFNEQHSEPNLPRDGLFARNADFKPVITSQYTLALKEHGDQKGEQPIYSIQKVSQTPPKFKAIVSFQGFTLEGTGRNQRLAKHEASKALCDCLNLEVV